MLTYLDRINSGASSQYSQSQSATHIHRPAGLRLRLHQHLRRMRRSTSAFSCFVEVYPINCCLFHHPSCLWCIICASFNHLQSVFEDISAVASTFKLAGLRKLSIMYRVLMLVCYERANQPVTLDDLDIDCFQSGTGLIFIFIFGCVV